jgi:uncharacterized membrane protein
METVIVAVFTTERDAYAGSSALRTLDGEGSIALYAMSVIAKNEHGELEIKQAADRGAIGTGVGLLTGSLLGLLAGPVGFAITTTAGLLGGAIYDLSKLGISERYLTEVGTELGPNRFAVVAEVWEEWTTPVDERLSAAGGVVFRTQRGVIVDAQIEEDARASRRELDQLEEELRQAASDTRAKIETKVANVRAKLRTTKERADAQIASVRAETEAKVTVLRDKAAHAHGKRKERLEAHITALQQDLAVRSDKLKAAAKLAGEALS